MTIPCIVTTQLSTPLGTMIAGALPTGICFLDFMDRGLLDKQYTRLEHDFSTHLVPGDSPLFQQLHRELQEYFARTRTIFTLPLDYKGTPFQHSVWQALLTIPYGKTISYQEQAGIIHNPKAVRAVAKTNKSNRIVILVPCHRVIGKNGTMIGYGGGIWRKEFLLNLENSEILLNSTAGHSVEPDHQF